ncbi:MAG: biotin--[acetyl-CoA-carboxylase] ligase [Lentisphaerae bacterium]|nr:biotin--[acetyl-CoA-carboxylase] ligase [Lentisphaerota bacterium]
MNSPEILPGLGLWGGRLILFRELPSTNRWALDHAGMLAHGDVVSAVFQTGGYGRLGRTWKAGRGGDIALSVVVDPARMPGAPLQAFPLAAAAAAADTLLGLSVPAMLKWPNDVESAGAKICGILAERRGNDGSPVVVGMGMNVNMHAHEATLIEGRRATSISISKGTPADAAMVRAALLKHLQRWFECIARQGMAPLLRAWPERDALAGCRVALHSPCGTVEGDYLGLDEEGMIRIRTDTGEQSFSAGDVERVRAV